MTTTKLFPMLAAVLLSGPVLAADLPRLPPGLKLAQMGDSPGVVTFNHDMHVDSAKPACLSCHPAQPSGSPTPGFSILGRSAEKGRPAITHAAMEKGQSCGACHRKTAFAFDDCTMCHAM
jgi:c(7)-type cytochrome triheme protein